MTVKKKFTRLILDTKFDFRFFLTVTRFVTDDLLFLLSKIEVNIKIDFQSPIQLISMVKSLSKYRIKASIDHFNVDPRILDNITTYMNDELPGVKKGVRNYSMLNQPNFSYFELRDFIEIVDDRSNKSCVYQLTGFSKNIFLFCDTPRSYDEISVHFTNIGKAKLNLTLDFLLSKKIICFIEGHYLSIPIEFHPRKFDGSKIRFREVNGGSFVEGT